MVDRIELHDGGEPVFEAAGIQQGADRAFKDRVELPSGGYLFIEQTEAMHVIDVNSGRSGKGKSQAENSLNVNLEAARVIARQIRLRDLGGIIVVDFIDLRGEKDKKKVYDELKKGFSDDRAVTKVLPMSDFGLVEITRQRLRPSITTTFSSANGAPSPDEDGGDTDKLRRAERKIQRLEQEVEKREEEVERLKEKQEGEDADAEAAEVEHLREKIRQLEQQVEEARAKAREREVREKDQSREQPPPDTPPPTGNGEPQPSGAAVQAQGAAASPDEFVEAVEQWITEHRGQHRSVTLRVHPFTAAFLRRPVPTYPTRWFMDHLVRVHLDPDEDLDPLAFRVVDAQGELLADSS
jgi:ribonuclease G